MVNLDRREELLRCPSLWLCLGCQACTEACTQQVAGHLVMRGLQELSIRRGMVPADFRARLWAIDRALLFRYLQEVDVLLEKR
jgi:heterodisulfide reductase subunit C